LSERDLYLYNPIALLITITTTMHYKKTDLYPPAIFKVDIFLPTDISEPSLKVDFYPSYLILIYFINNVSLSSRILHSFSHSLHSFSIVRIDFTLRFNLHTHSRLNHPNHSLWNLNWLILTHWTSSSSSSGSHIRWTLSSSSGLKLQVQHSLNLCFFNMIRVWVNLILD
jgi:hypothetical protein